MIKILLVLLFIIFQLGSVSVFSAEAVQPDNELFLIAGSPEDNSTDFYPVILYGINTDQTLNRIRPIATRGQKAKFVRPYYEDKMVLVGSHVQQGYFQLDYIDMENVKLEKTYEIQLCEDCSYVYSFHLKKDSEILHLVRSLRGSGDELSSYNEGFNFNTLTNTEMDWEDYSFIQIFGGSSGNFESDYADGIFAFNNRPVNGAELVELAWSFPENLVLEDGERIVQFINNSELRVFSPASGSMETQGGSRKITYYAYDKSSESWSSFELLNAGWLKAFGKWIVTDESYRGFQDQELLREYALQIRDGEIPEPMYRPMLYRYAIWDIQKTGLLYLINPVENIFIEINTGNPDSEILLVENENVIYRIADRIYSAVIENNELSEPSLIAQDPNVPGIHWAFFGNTDNND